MPSNSVADLYQPTLNYLGENAFPGHDAIADNLSYITALVALFADLCYEKLNTVADKQFLSDRCRVKAYSLGGDVFGELTGLYCQHTIIHFGKRFVRKKRDLAFRTGMSIAQNTEPGHELSLGNVSFLAADLG
jgi:hypothetical protein